MSDSEPAVIMIKIRKTSPSPFVPPRLRAALKHTRPLRDELKEKCQHRATCPEAGLVPAFSPVLRPSTLGRGIPFPAEQEVLTPYSLTWKLPLLLQSLPTTDQPVLAGNSLGTRRAKHVACNPQL